MLSVKLWRRLLGVDDRVVVEPVEFDDEVDAVVAHVRPKRLRKQRCGRCGTRAPATSRARTAAVGGRSIWVSSAHSSSPTPEGELP